MEICPTNGSLGVRLGCIASYDGGLLDSVLNYSAVAATAWALMALAFCGGRRPVAVSIALTVFYVAFQFGLCLALGCAGVSVVWAASIGAAWAATLFSSYTWQKQGESKRWRWRSRQHIPLFLITAFDVALIAYYAVVEEASLCPKLFGPRVAAVCSFLSYCLCGCCGRRQ